jgi:hypothetical protein
MDNLDAVAFVENALLPICAPDHFPVKLYGKAFGREAEMFDEISQRQ